VLHIYIYIYIYIYDISRLGVKLTFNNAHIVMRFLRYPTLLHGSTLGFRGKPLRKQC